MASPRSPRTFDPLAIGKDQCPCSKYACLFGASKENSGHGVLTSVAGDEPGSGPTNDFLRSEYLIQGLSQAMRTSDEKPLRVEPIHCNLLRTTLGGKWRIYPRPLEPHAIQSNANSSARHRVVVF